MGQAVSTFFTTTVVTVAKNAWSTVVHALTAFAGWLGHQVTSFVNSVIQSITTLADNVKKFFINVWHDVEEFTRKIFPAKPNVKDWFWDKTYDIGEGIRKCGIEHMRARLKALGYKVDGVSDDDIVKEWKKYMSAHPLSPEDQKEVDDLLNDGGGAPHSNTVMSGSGGYSNTMMSGTRSYSKLHGTIPPQFPDFQHKKGDVITPLFFVYPEHLPKGPPKKVHLAPDEVEQLNLILST